MLDWKTDSRVVPVLTTSSKPAESDVAKQLAQTTPRSRHLVEAGSGVV